MQHTLCALSAFVLILAPAACVVGETSGCDFRTSGANGPEPRCQERTGIQGGEAFEATCSSLQGVAIDGECPRDGIIAGCEIAEDVVDWYYGPKTAADVDSDCAADNGTVVQP